MCPASYGAGFFVPCCGEMCMISLVFKPQNCYLTTYRRCLVKNVYFILAVLLLPLCAAAQAVSEPATYTIPLGKHFGIDSQIPVEVNQEELNTRFNQYMQQVRRQTAQMQKRAEKAAQRHRQENKEPAPVYPALNWQPSQQPAWPLFNKETPAWLLRNKQDVPCTVPAEKKGPVADAGKADKREAYRRELDKKRLVKALQRIMLQSAKS